MVKAEGKFALLKLHERMGISADFRVRFILGTFACGSIRIIELPLIFTMFARGEFKLSEYNTNVRLVSYNHGVI